MTENDLSLVSEVQLPTIEDRIAQIDNPLGFLAMGDELDAAHLEEVSTLVDQISTAADQEDLDTVLELAGQMGVKEQLFRQRQTLLSQHMLMTYPDAATAALAINKIVEDDLREAFRQKWARTKAIAYMNRK